MWEIREHNAMRRQLGGLPLIVRKRYEIWKEVAMHSGVDGLARVRGFQDGRLRGEWTGWRSSRVGAKHRVIYRYVYRKFWPMFILTL